MTDARVRRFQDARKFYRLVEPFLIQHEAENNLFLGVCGTLLAEPDRMGPDVYLAVVEQGGRVTAAAVRTLPYRLVISHIADPETLPLLARDVRGVYEALPGVLGPQALSKAFAAAWSTLAGAAHRDGRSMRIYRLEIVQHPVRPAGSLRQARPDDREMLIQWLWAFQREALGEDDRTNVERIVDLYLENSDRRGTFFWEDGNPVAMASYSGPTPHGIRVNAVYTPPDYRRRGYASALVAGLSQHLLDGGRKFCFLFTDLANPTSNHIYQQVGYKPVSDVTEYLFGSELPV